MLPLLNVKEPFFDAEEHFIVLVCVCVHLFVSVCSYTGVCYSLSADRHICVLPYLC